MERYRTFLPRLVALLIDSFIMLPSGILDDFFRQAQFPPAFFYVWIPLSSLVFPVYMITMHGLYGQTLGKMWMNVKVLDARTEESIQFSQAILREAPQLVFNIGAIYLGIAFLGEDLESERVRSAYGVAVGFAAVWALADTLTFLLHEKRRALHDLLAGTVVIKINS
jgi:uncharacterized RDD family membrane protein YckC